MSDPRGDEAADQTEHRHVETRVETRAELLPEEQAAGSADPEAQAAAVLADSDERTADPEGTRDDSVQSPERDDRG